MEGLNNPNKLEALWKQSKAKKLWDDSHRPLDQHLSQHHPAEDSVSIEDYMSRWCNIIQTPNSPTPQEDYRMPQTCSSKKLLTKRSSKKILFQTSMISRKLKTRSTSALLSKIFPTSGLSTLQSWKKIKLSSNISNN